MGNINEIEHSLYYYQERDMNKLIENLEVNRKVCFQAITSYGKTQSFCTLAKWFKQKYNKKILVLAHREELVSQSSATFTRLGMTVEKVLPGVKRYHHQADAYVSMEMTLWNKLKKNKNFLKDVGLVIIDECHIGNFDKLVNFFTEPKIVGFTATPLRNDKITYFKCPRCKSTDSEIFDCCGRESEEWSKPHTLSMYYDDIVIGASTIELIEFGSIVRDKNYIEKTNDLSELKQDSKGEYTTESQNKVFANSESVLSCLLNYEKICKGEKVLIFNPSSKVNKMVYDQFKEKGYNVKMYDSVNETDEKRQDIVDWFEKSSDGVLCNVSVYTTGFSVNSVQAIILNRAIGSLPLFLQIVGRGARSCNTMFKDSFKVLDLGGCVDAHNKWSDDTRDWRKMFFEGIGKDKCKTETPLSLASCSECGYLFARSESTCPNCGYKEPEKPRKERIASDTILVPLEPPKMPTGKSIADYVIRNKGNIHTAFNIMYQSIINLFSDYLVSKGQYLNNKNDGRLDKRLGEIIRPVYFQLLNTPEFKQDSNRTLKYVTKKTIEKLDKYYNID